MDKNEQTAVDSSVPTPLRAILDTPAAVTGGLARWSAYLGLLGLAYQTAYWGTFGINVFSFARLSDLIQLSAQPVFSKVILLLPIAILLSCVLVFTRLTRHSLAIWHAGPVPPEQRTHTRPLVATWSVGLLGIAATLIALFLSGQVTNSNNGLLGRNYPEIRQEWLSLGYQALALALIALTALWVLARTPRVPWSRLVSLASTAVLIVLPLLTFGLGRLDGLIAQEPIRFGGYARLMGLPLYTYQFGQALCVALDDEVQWWSPADLESFEVARQKWEARANNYAREYIEDLELPPLPPSAPAEAAPPAATASPRPLALTPPSSAGQIAEEQTRMMSLVLSLRQIRAVGKVGDYDFFYGPNRRKLFVRHRDALRTYALQECSDEAGSLPKSGDAAVFETGSWASGDLNRRP